MISLYICYCRFLVSNTSLIGSFIPFLLSILRCEREVSSHSVVWFVLHAITSNTTDVLLPTTEHTDPGSRADPTKPHLLSSNTKTRDITPYIGTELRGVQISQLTKEGLDELALYTAERKLLVFRDQDFKDLTPERQIEIARYVYFDLSIEQDSQYSRIK